MATSATPVTTPVVSTPVVPRVIPGLVSSTIVLSSKTRSRKTKKPTEEVVVETPIELITPTQTNGVEVEKRTSAVETVQRKLKAQNKKIQRVVAYEEKTAELNEDQRKAIMTKPVLEAVSKELQELLVILKAEEIEEDLRLAQIKAEEATAAESRIAEAVEAVRAESQISLKYLLEFLHLHDLLLRSPRTVPSVLEKEIAAIRYLRDVFANGPNPSGMNESVEQLAKLVNSSPDEVVLDVSFARINTIISTLYSPIAAIEESSAPAIDEPVVADVPTPTAAVETPSFLQASELSLETLQLVEEPVAPVADPVVASGWGAPSKPMNWADDDNQSGLPDLEGLAPVVAPKVKKPRPPKAKKAPVAAPAPVAEVEDGFVSVVKKVSSRGGRGGGQGVGREQGVKRENGDGSAPRGRGGRGRGKGAPKTGEAPPAAVTPA